MRLTVLIFLDSMQAKSKLLSFLIIRAHVSNLIAVEKAQTTLFYRIIYILKT